jgi:hypothetical protein
MKTLSELTKKMDRLRMRSEEREYEKAQWEKQ